MQASLRISVAMAAYNGEKYIREQLDSIARQTLLPCELVVTDDGSTDATVAIVEAFALEAPFAVRMYRNPERLGYADNFLKAASLCEGDVVAFCDQDDIWMEGKLRTCAPFFADPEVLVAAHSAWTLLPSGQRGRRFPDYRRNGRLNWGKADPFGFAHGFAMVARRQLFDTGLYGTRPQKVYGHDQWIWFLAAATGKIATIAEPLTLYRQHEANLYGVGEKITAVQLARRIAGTQEYDRLAADESACAQALMAVAERDAARAKRLHGTAKKIEKRAMLHRLRTRMYAPDSGMLRRAGVWSRILFLGGYWWDPSHTRLGPRAALKDLTYGVTGWGRLRP